MTRIEISPMRTRKGLWLVKAIGGKLNNHIIVSDVPYQRALAKAQSFKFGKDVPILKTGDHA